jgi:pantetheine-phosphate adenylyltransferase
MSRAVYPGSFDPITNGHLDIIQRALKVFDEVTVLVAHNARKTGLFTTEERVQLIRESLAPDDNVLVESFEGLLVDYAAQRQINVVLRGLRAVADFEYEGQMANMNRHLYPQLETFFMMTSADNFYVSSSLVREVATLGGNISALVPPPVEKALRIHLPTRK